MGTGSLAQLKGRARVSTKTSPEESAIAALLTKSKLKGVTFDLRKGVLVLRVRVGRLLAAGVESFR